MKTKTVWSETYRMLGEYPDKFKNKIDIAHDIGIGWTYFYAFFKGNRILGKKYLEIIANYFKLPIENVTKEHRQNIEKLKRDRGL